MLQFLKHILAGQNQFASGGLVEVSGAQTMAEFQGVLLGLEQEQPSCELATQ
jgi:hypothetical protein